MCLCMCICICICICICSCLYRYTWNGQLHAIHLLGAIPHSLLFSVWVHWSLELKNLKLQNYAVDYGFIIMFVYFPYTLWYRFTVCELENHHFKEVNQLFLWAIFNSYVTNYQSILWSLPHSETRRRGVNRPAVIPQQLPPGDIRTSTLHRHWDKHDPNPHFGWVPADPSIGLWSPRYEW